jgi:hypothetical protein
MLVFQNGFNQLTFGKKNMKKTDPHTGEEFIPKRSNQVFVKPQNRKDYHNHRAKLMRHTCSYLDKPLKKNIQIILELMPKSKEQIFHKQFLLGKGFSFEASNNVHEVEGKIHHCVYNFAIIPMGKDQIKILKYA